MIISRLEGSALMLNVQKITYVLKDHSKDDLRMIIDLQEENALMSSVQKII